MPFLSSHPLVRGIIYGLGLVFTIASLALGEILPGEAVTRAIVVIADYLTALAGATALSHLNMQRPPLDKP